MELNIWWIWAAIAVVFAIGEVLLPSYILLGFSLGAVVIALTMAVGGMPAEWVASSVPLTLLVYAVISLAAWLLLRRILGHHEGQVKTFDSDINDH